MRHKEDRKLRQGVKHLARLLCYSPVPIIAIVPVFLDILHAV